MDLIEALVFLIVHNNKFNLIALKLDEMLAHQHKYMLWLWPKIIVHKIGCLKILIWVIVFIAVWYTPGKKMLK